MVKDKSCKNPKAIFSGLDTRGKLTKDKKHAHNSHIAEPLWLNLNKEKQRKAKNLLLLISVKQLCLSIRKINVRSVHKTEVSQFQGLWCSFMSSVLFWLFSSSCADLCHGKTQTCSQSESGVSTHLHTLCFFVLFLWKM